MHRPTAKLIIARMRAKAERLIEAAGKKEIKNPHAATIGRFHADGLGQFADELLEELQDPNTPTVEAMELPGGGLMITTTPKLDEKTVERLRAFMMQPPMLPGRCPCVIVPVCPDCDGTGTQDGETCYRCDGQG